MQVILTDIEKPLSIPWYNGTITLQDIKVWPAWIRSKSNGVLFSYELKHQPLGTYSVKLEYGKTYTFEDIRLLLGNYFNKLNTVCDLTFDNNGRVNLDFQTKFAFKNLKLSKELAYALRLPYLNHYDNIDDKVTIGTSPMRKDDVKLTFSDTDFIMLQCDQINNTYLNNDLTKAIYITPTNEINLKHPPTVTFSNTYKQLTFSIKDMVGNKLPTKNVLIRLLINGKCLSRKNLSGNTFSTPR